MENDKRIDPSESSPERSEDMSKSRQINRTALIDNQTGEIIGYRDDSDIGLVVDLLDMSEVITDPTSGKTRRRYEAVDIDSQTGKPIQRE